MNERVEHWDTIYAGTEEQRLGWYEENTEATFRLLEKVGELQGKTAILPGVGTSMLAAQLLARGMTVVANDISPEAIRILKHRIGKGQPEVFWVCQDIADPFGVEIPKADLWIDRAVLHFLTEEGDIEGYFGNLKNTLRAGGYALFVEFPSHGAERCAGLELHRYSEEEFLQRLGDGFIPVDHFEFTYINPVGKPLPYTYQLFRRSA